MMPRKRKGVYMDKNQRETKKEKQFEEVKESRGEAAIGVDHISELPEHLIHHILSRLRCSKDVARTPVLSKKWKSYWASFQDIDFDQKNFQVQISQVTSGRSEAAVAEKIDFMNYVNRFMETRLKLLGCLNSFRLNVISFDKQLMHVMNRCINAAIEKDLKELQVHVKAVNDRRYYVPEMVLTSRTITSLKLLGCRLNGLPAAELPNLRQLSLKSTRINEDIIHNFFRSSPLIEDLRLVECTHLEKLHVPVLLNLKRVEVHKCLGLRSIEIMGTSLQTFCYCEKERIQCNINLACYENLRNLTIKANKMTDDWFQEQILTLQDLENLTLLECLSLKRITILSSKLKRLSLIKCRNLEDANIIAPNLSLFEYTGNKLCFSTLDYSRLQEVKINFEIGLCLSEAEKFQESISRIEGFILVLQKSGQKEVRIFEGSSDIKLSESSGYNIKITRSPRVLRETINQKLQQCRPLTLVVFYSSHSKSIQVIEEMLLNRGDALSCCHYYKNKCWKHYIKHFTTIYKGEGMAMFGLLWHREPAVVSFCHFQMEEMETVPAVTHKSCTVYP